MFSGIIESTGVVKKIEQEGSNYHFTIAASISPELYIDQSIAHNGVCLTVVKKSDNDYVVTAIKETLDLSNLKDWKLGDLINLERCVKADQRMDGHFVQGHVDSTASCTGISNEKGSWYFSFKYPNQFKKLLVSKGSITINGVSLTLIDPDADTFKVGIIPYTYEHTNFKDISIGDEVNIEYDILGKYFQRHMSFN